MSGECGVTAVLETGEHAGEEVICNGCPRGHGDDHLQQKVVTRNEQKVVENIRFAPRFIRENGLEGTRWHPHHVTRLRPTRDGFVPEEVDA